MNEDSPIIVIDDDEEEYIIYKPLLDEIAPARPVLFFDDGDKALEYLKNAQDPPFIIFSDLRLPGMNGLELRQAIEDDPRLKKQAIPFVFFSQQASSQDIEQAYDMSVQGFFEKKSDLAGLRRQLRLIIDYWTDCLHPKLIS